jgi:hypothetical protein
MNQPETELPIFSSPVYTKEDSGFFTDTVFWPLVDTLHAKECAGAVFLDPSAESDEYSPMSVRPGPGGDIEVALSAHRLIDRSSSSEVQVRGHAQLSLHKRVPEKTRELYPELDNDEVQLWRTVCFRFVTQPSVARFVAAHSHSLVTPDGTSLVRDEMSTLQVRLLSQTEEKLIGNLNKRAETALTRQSVLEVAAMFCILGVPMYKVDDKLAAFDRLA